MSDNVIPELSFTPLPCAATRKFDQARAGQTVLLCAPAGTGKTVAAVAYARKVQRKSDATVGWVTVTESAFDLVTALADALGHDLPRAGLCAPTERAADVIAAMTTPTVLIIDDAHKLTDPLHLAALEFVLTHLPDNATVLLAGRFAPPLRWHTIDLAGRLTRIGTTDLALSPERIIQLFAQHGCALAPTEAAQVNELTQGWAALVRIAALYLATNPDDHATAFAALARPSHAVADFLVAELVDALSPDTLAFLLATAVPTEFCLPLAEYLAGPGTARIIDDLLRANFPIATRVHDGELWHSYHPMLRAYLLAELAHSHPDDLPGAHRRAADWFGMAGLPARALDHVLAEPGAPGLGEFVSRWGMRMVLAGSGQELLDALDHVPDLAADSFVRLLRAAVAVDTGDVAAAEVYLEAAHVNSDSPSKLVAQEWHSTLDQAISAGVAVLVGDAASLHWPTPMSTTHADLDCYAALHCGAAAVFGGEPDAGAVAVRRALVHAEQAGLDRVVVRAATVLAFAAGLAGKVGEMAAMADYAIDHALTPSARASVATEEARVLAAYAAHLRGASIDAGALPMPTVRPSDSAPDRYAELMTGLLTLDNAPDRALAATALARTLERLIAEAPLPYTTGALVVDLTGHLLRLHLVDVAKHLVDLAQRELEPSVELTIAEASLALHGQRAAGALALLEPLGPESVGKHPVSAVTVALLTGVAADRLDRARLVEESFERALLLATAEQLIRPFLDVVGVSDIVDRFGGRCGQYDSFVDRIRAARPSTPGAPQLTGTELVVLRHLPSGLTASKIATDMGVSVNTVKTHMRGIYQKLGVNARGEAIVRARGVGLL
ncbi:LuxR C-terminal-related transcriptional regulator [Nocardia camponoti]|uniref:LuxR family transcriptional regulator n=1 Tax=Nocardia camponoti TaxID=1616106 RepID=A0A917V6V4_9NOCA|nr:LuxR C-terminal-related transcriptional regulator [Nocardia camponoti]GGK45651.1 LuxR family transcriptional regulator [Nocardia camponoti]